MLRPMFAIVAVAVFASAGFAAPQENQTPPPPTPPQQNAAPVDKPVHFDGPEAGQKLEKAIAPYVAKGKKTYPDAKARFLQGLPKGHRFFVTVKLTENNHQRQETIFIAVRAIKDGKITGAIASQLTTLRTYKAGQIITLPESDVLDWTISRPDGTEEGNFVGKFLDTYKP